MKYIKYITSILLSIIICLSTMAPAFAVDDSDTGSEFDKAFNASEGDSISAKLVYNTGIQVNKSKATSLDYDAETAANYAQSAEYGSNDSQKVNFSGANNAAKRAFENLMKKIIAKNRTAPTYADDSANGTMEALAGYYDVQEDPDDMLDIEAFLKSLVEMYEQMDPDSLSEAQVKNYQAACDALGRAVSDAIKKSKYYDPSYDIANQVADEKKELYPIATATMNPPPFLLSRLAVSIKGNKEGLSESVATSYEYSYTQTDKEFFKQFNKTNTTGINDKNDESFSAKTDEIGRNDARTLERSELKDISNSEWAEIAALNAQAKEDIVDGKNIKVNDRCGKAEIPQNVIYGNARYHIAPEDNQYVKKGEKYVTYDVLRMNGVVNHEAQEYMNYFKKAYPDITDTAVITSTSPDWKKLDKNLRNKIKLAAEIYENNKEEAGSVHTSIDSTKNYFAYYYDSKDIFGIDINKENTNKNGDGTDYTYLQDILGDMYANIPANKAGGGNIDVYEYFNGFGDDVDAAGNRDSDTKPFVNANTADVSGYKRVNMDIVEGGLLDKKALWDEVASSFIQRLAYLYKYGSSAALNDAFNLSYLATDKVTNVEEMDVSQPTFYTGNQAQTAWYLYNDSTGEQIKKEVVSGEMADKWETLIPKSGNYSIRSCAKAKVKYQRHITYNCKEYVVDAYTGIILYSIDTIKTISTPVREHDEFVNTDSKIYKRTNSGSSALQRVQ